PPGQGLIGSSTGNGDAQPPVGDIDSAGSRSREFANLPSAVQVAVRPLAGKLEIGQHILFDVDGIVTQPNGDDLDVFLGNATAARWNLGIHPFAIWFSGAGRGP